MARLRDQQTAPGSGLCAGKFADARVVGGHGRRRLRRLGRTGLGLLPAGQAELAAVFWIVLVAAAAVGAGVQIVVHVHALAAQTVVRPGSNSNAQLNSDTFQSCLERAIVLQQRG